MRARTLLCCVALLVVVAVGRGAMAESDCVDNMAVQVGRTPDVIFPEGKVSCIAVVPARFKHAAISALHNGNCGSWVSVKSGWPHVAIQEGAINQTECTAATFFPVTPTEINRTVPLGTISLDNLGFTLFHDGTLPAGSSGTIEYLDRVGTDLSNEKYSIGSFNYFVAPANPVVTDSAFTHMVTVANTPVASHSILSHPLLDGQANANPLATALENYGDSGFVDNNHPIALVYGIDVANRWSLINLDGAALPMGAQFNIEAASATDYSQYIVPANAALAFTIPSLMDFNFTALLFATALSTGNPRVPTTYFDAPTNTWAIFTATRDTLTPGARYGVRFIGSPDPAQYVFRATATSDNIWGETLFLDNGFGLNSLSRVFISPVSTVWAPQVPGIWWTGGGWAIYNEDWSEMPLGAEFNVYWHQPALLASPKKGDVTADKKADIALIGGSLSTMPVAASQGNGSFALPTNSSDPNFPFWAQTSGAKPLPGDFDGDGRTDIALTGPGGWNTIPIAFSMGDGTFRVSNGWVGIGEHTAGVPYMPYTRPAFGSPWDTNFPAYAAAAGARPIAADLNGDGATDLVLLGGMSGIPVAFSRGEGNFVGKLGSVTSGYTDFATTAMQSGLKYVAGDFDGDGRDDLALTGGVGWNTIPIAFSNGDATFRATNAAVSTIPSLTVSASTHALAGDFNADGKTDIAVCGNTSTSVYYAYSIGDGTFQVGNSGNVASLTTMCTTSSKVFTGDFDGNGKTDIGAIDTTVGAPQPPLGLRPTFYTMKIGMVGASGTITVSTFSTPSQNNGQDIQSLAQRFNAIPISASKTIR